MHVVPEEHQGGHVVVEVLKVGVIECMREERVVPPLVQVEVSERHVFVEEMRIDGEREGGAELSQRGAMLGLLFRVNIKMETGKAK